MSKSLQTNIRIYFYWENGPNTNINYIWGQFYYSICWFEYLFSLLGKDDQINDSVKNNAVCWAAKATPGLLKVVFFFFFLCLANYIPINAKFIYCIYLKFPCSSRKQEHILIFCHPFETFYTSIHSIQCYIRIIKHTLFRHVICRDLYTNSICLG